MITYDDVRVSPNFRLSELTVSEKRPDLVDPVPAAYQPNACRLIVDVLQPIRDIWVKGPVTLLSGYRSPALNNAIGGSTTSQHLRAEAADITFSGCQDVFADLVNEGSIVLGHGYGVDLGQAIYYPSRHFIHVALPSRRYPKPTFCLHEPTRGLHYHVLAGPDELRRLLP